ncbi:MAG: hypothetical protein OFPI_18310 [Osedax symbiont Rs2]|nr:MAG: hypothetical protein OFPI_18310 [Osedax symbiont Rs2]
MQLFPEFVDGYRTLLDCQLKEEAEETWNDHLNGAYGLCVVNPSSVAAIIEKQIAVRRLASATENGKNKNSMKKNKPSF